MGDTSVTHPEKYQRQYLYDKPNEARAIGECLGDVRR